ncbi:hypothetical protein [Polymorphospora rubra]|uniref:hypothetical protein n=1 Tax=Polymorphospora rubra TaxID=338584 RepID=UPI0033C2BF67
MNATRKASIAAKAMLVGLLAAGGLAVSSGAATAYSDSGKTNGCWVRMWNTASSLYCQNVTQSGQFQGVVECRGWTGNYNESTGWHYLTRGSTAMPVASLNDCSRSINKGWVNYTSGT